MLELIADQNHHRRVILTDEPLRIGPLPEQVDAGAAVAAESLAAVEAHFSGG